MKESDQMLNLTVQDVKNATIETLLKDEDTHDFYVEYMNIILESANKGYTSTDEGIWEVISNYSYEAKQNVIKILQLKGFDISSFGGRVSWGISVNADY